MRKNYRWNSVKAIKQSVGNILNGYIGGEVDGEVLRNVIYAANCLINCCKTINEEEIEELKQVLEELENERNEKY